MENRAHALAAGLFVLLLVLCVALAGWWFAGKREPSREILLVSQRNVTGLSPQSQVRFRGIRVGKVLDIALDPMDRRSILVRISIPVRIPISKSTTAQLNSQGVTGMAYVQLEDSGKSDELLPPGATPLPRIALKETLIESLGERAMVMAAQVSEIAANLNRLLDERGHLNRTLENLASASDALKDMPKVMAGVREALSPANMKHLQMILAHLERTAGEAAPLTVEMRALVAQLAGVGKHFDQLLTDTGGEISATTLPRVNALLADLDKNSQQLGRLIESLNEAPQSLIFGRGAAKPGPGETGFAPPLK